MRTKGNRQECSLKRTKDCKSLKKPSTELAQIIEGLRTWGNDLEHGCCCLSQKLLLGKIAAFGKRVARRGWSSLRSLIFFQPSLGSQGTQQCARREVLSLRRLGLLEGKHGFNGSVEESRERHRAQVTSEGILNVTPTGREIMSCHSHSVSC